MTFTLRYMTLHDVPQVAAIDRASFDLPWSERSYAYEVAESSYSYMAALEAVTIRQAKGWLRWLSAWNGSQRALEHLVVGFGGLWNVGDEAHISTIAVHPAWRGRGLGEILLAGMIRRSLALRAGFVALEVRVSNVVAQNLYRKYEFQVVGVKQRYYRNNDEDAYDMRLDLTDEAAVARFDQRLAALQARQPFIDRYSGGDRPRQTS